MNENFYLRGIEICFIVSALIAVICSVYMDSQKPENNNYSFYSNIKKFGIDKAVDVGIGVSIFLMIYPIINLLLNSQHIDFYKDDLEEGIIGLRIASIVLGFNFLKSFYNCLNNNFSDNHKKLTIEYPDLQNLKSSIDDNYINMIILTQNLIYSTIAFSAWTFIFLSIPTMLQSKLIRWGLFFIIDDWAIISDNLIFLKGRVLKLHKLRIILFNFLLFFLTISAIFQVFKISIYSIYFSISFGVLIVVNMIMFYPKTYREIKEMMK